MPSDVNPAVIFLPTPNPSLKGGGFYTRVQALYDTIQGLHGAVQALYAAVPAASAICCQDTEIPRRSCVHQG